MGYNKDVPTSEHRIAFQPSEGTNHPTLDQDLVKQWEHFRLGHDQVKLKTTHQQYYPESTPATNEKYDAL